MSALMSSRERNKEGIRMTYDIESFDADVDFFTGDNSRDEIKKALLHVISCARLMSSQQYSNLMRLRE